MTEDPLLRRNYEEMCREYAREDPWSYGTCLYEKSRHAVMTEFALAGAPRSVLDLGCGEGHFLAHLLAKKPGLRATGVELVPEAAARCRSRLAGYDAAIHTADLLDFLAAPPAGLQADAVICGDVLFLLPPELVSTRVVPGVAALLPPEGPLVISSAGMHDDKRWTVDAFTDRFRLVREMHLQPLIDPPPCTWYVSLLTKEEAPKHEHPNGAEQPGRWRRAHTRAGPGGRFTTKGAPPSPCDGSRFPRG